MGIPLNDALVAGRVTRSSDRSGRPDTRLGGRGLIFARGAWVTLVSLIVGLFLARLPVYYAALQTVCTGAGCGSPQPTPDSAQALQKLGLSAGAYADFTLALSIALALVCFTLGAVIFWRRSDDWLALLGALAVAASVTLNANVYGMDMSSAWGWLAMAMNVLGDGAYLLYLSLTLDGRLVTRWAPLLLLCWVGAVFVYFIFMYSFFYMLVWLAALGLLFIAQVYHSRTAASPLQRRQTKWLFFGGGAAVVIAVGLTVLRLIFPSLGQAGSFYQLVLEPAYLVLSFVVPLCLGLAILRYRLYDIDIVIHRTLVYSTLTASLAVIYGISVFALQSFTNGLAFMRGNQLGIVASTFLIWGLFKPLHARTRSLIDRRFYRRKYDAARTMAAFSATLRHEVDLDRLREALLTVVQETMQPAHVSLWLRPTAPDRGDNGD